MLRHRGLERPTDLLKPLCFTMSWHLKHLQYVNSITWVCFAMRIRQICFYLGRKKNQRWLTQTLLRVNLTNINIHKSKGLKEWTAQPNPFNMLSQLLLIKYSRASLSNEMWKISKNLSFYNDSSYLYAPSD
jgi:hypothetical protein